MSEPRWAIVSGAAGSIGAATAAALRAAGYRTLGLDLAGPPTGVAFDAFVTADVGSFSADEAAGRAITSQILNHIGDAPVAALVNNAATQRLGSTADLSWQDWTDTLAVNISAPFFLAQALLPKLRAAKAVIVNVGSVHARATKPGFVAYATSKAALHGLTHALAVDLGPDVRVVGIAPAAIDTPMLRAGFEGDPDAFAQLEAVHPAGRIGTPQEAAMAIVWLASPAAAFMTGSILWLDGGVLSRLHDPR
ncbi:SDR family NAD(P)-dependent oxidoreductase [Phenylobacterium sp.]|uniref:SDR family NAD(P)-dependent oxidoreductase n=1 Tax=Phenylobacterium sp. TaxID=1871053 RepID=UPI002720A1C4|nr:SDR family oxidoreductase [Phenylobacterium sp.]MDO8380296.1 SDR family oxidoreductase [Phenylobacterium sp.]